MSHSAKILLSNIVDCLDCSSRSKRKLSVSFEGRLCAEYMAVRPRGREGGDGRKKTRRRGNGERTEATSRGFICSRAISHILWWESTSKHVVIPDPRSYARAVTRFCHPSISTFIIIIIFIILFLQNNNFVHGRISGVVVN